MYRALAALAVVFLVSCGGDGNDGRWAIAVPAMQADLRAGLDAARAENAQGLLDAKTRLAGECRKAGGYRPGTSEAERRVRAGCASQQLPIGE